MVLPRRGNARKSRPPAPIAAIMACSTASGSSQYSRLRLLKDMRERHAAEERPLRQDTEKLVFAVIVHAINPGPSCPGRALPGRMSGAEDRSQARVDGGRHVHQSAVRGINRPRVLENGPSLRQAGLPAKI